MLIISKNVKLSKKDIELLRSKGEIVITGVTANGTDDISIAVEQEENNKEA
ncbi:hypothetical protein HYI16_17650, partial [Clostridium botulinum]|nr:hypothetical protein [Clostridium botulinum]